MLAYMLQPTRAAAQRATGRSPGRNAASGAGSGHSRGALGELGLLEVGLLVEDEHEHEGPHVALRRLRQQAEADAEGAEAAVLRVAAEREDVARQQARRRRAPRRPAGARQVVPGTSSGRTA